MDPRSFASAPDPEAMRAFTSAASQLADIEARLIRVILDQNTSRARGPRDANKQTSPCVRRAAFESSDLPRKLFACLLALFFPLLGDGEFPVTSRREFLQMCRVFPDK